MFKYGKSTLNDNSVIQTSIFVTEEDKILHHNNIVSLQSKYTTKAMHSNNSRHTPLENESYNTKIKEETRNSDSFVVTRSSSIFTPNLLNHFVQNEKILNHSKPLPDIRASLTISSSFNRAIKKLKKKSVAVFKNSVIMATISQFTDIKALMNMRNSCKIFRENLPLKGIQKCLLKSIAEGLNTITRIQYWTHFCIAIGRSQEGLYNRLITDNKYSFTNQIRKDIDRTFPSIQYFDKGKSGYNKLLNVLVAISKEFPQVGYCQGMNFVAAIIIINLNKEEESFWMMRYIMKEMKYKKLFSHSLESMRLCYYQLECFINTYCPRLYQHLVKR